MSERERDEQSKAGRRDFLRKLGIGAAVVATPVGLAGCFNNPYFPH
jgi:hypothetical protein